MDMRSQIKHAKIAGKAHEVQVGYPGHHMKELMTGTTIMATTFGEGMDGLKKGVVIGADSRTSTGTFVANRVTDKLTRITDNIYACRSGSAADTQAIVDIVQYYLRVLEIESGQMPKVETAAKLTADMCYKYKDRFLASLIIAGWDDTKGGQVYAIPLGGTVVEQPWTIGGSGSTFVYGLCDKEFNPEASTEEAVKFVRTIVTHAVKRDGSSGGVCRTAIITEDGLHREIWNMDTQSLIGTQ